MQAGCHVPALLDTRRQPVCWHGGPVSPLQGSREWGCRQRKVKGASGDVFSPAPRGPGLREGGGASLISLPPWQGGPLVLRRPVGGPGVASLMPGKGVLESTEAAAAAGGAVAPLGVKPPLASWALQSCWWRWSGAGVAGATLLWQPLGCHCHHHGSSQRP